MVTAVEDFISYPCPAGIFIAVYEEVYRELVKKPLRSGDFQPKLTDSEVYHDGIAGKWVDRDPDKSWRRHFRNWRRVYEL